MSRIKLSESQINMLKNFNNNKTVKITTEQYNRIFESDFDSEVTQVDAIKPSTKVTKHFKKQTKSNPKSNFKFENEGNGMNNNPSEEEFSEGIIKYLKMLMVNQDETPKCAICERYDVSSEDVFEKMLSIGLITYNIVKDRKIIQIKKSGFKENISKIYGMFTSGIEENKSSDDNIRKAMSEPFEKKHKQEIPHNMIKDKINKIRAKELARRKSKGEIDINEEPLNSNIGGLNLEIYNDDYAILELNNKYYAFCMRCVDKEEFLKYQDRPKKSTYKDEDGDPQVEYEDAELEDKAVETYINNNMNNLKLGKGLNDWEEGSDMVLLDRDMVNKIKSDIKYIDNPTEKEGWVEYMKNGFGIDETTMAAGSSGSFVGPMSGGGRKPIHKGITPKDAMSKTGLKEGGTNKKSLDESLGLELKYNNITHPKLGTYYIKDIYDKKDYAGKVRYIITLNDDNGEISTNNLLYIYDKENDKEELLFNYRYEKLYEVDKIFDEVYDLVFDELKSKLRPTADELTEQGIGNSGQYATPGFASSEFMGTKNKKGKAKVNKGVTHNKTMYSKGKFVDESNKPKPKELKNPKNSPKPKELKNPKNSPKPKELKNKKDVDENNNNQTAYPSGEFVELDDCTKLNNNKVAQNGGCSVGAVDNVVKTKKTKNSIISKDAIYSEIAKKTGKTVSEVKNIIKKKRCELKIEFNINKEQRRVKGKYKSLIRTFWTCDIILKCGNKEMVIDYIQFGTPSRTKKGAISQAKKEVERIRDKEDFYIDGFYNKYGDIEV